MKRYEHNLFQVVIKQLHTGLLFEYYYYSDYEFNTNYNTNKIKQF